MMLLRSLRQTAPIGHVFKRTYSTQATPGRLSGKVAIITGGGDGIGRESCLLFAKHGAKVVVVDVNTKRGNETADIINKDGGDGIGRESCLLFAKHGAKVVVVDINSKRGNETADLINKDGGDAFFHSADVSVASAVEQMVSVAEKKYGKVNVIFNNAGVMLSEDDDAVHTSEATWDKTMEINLKGVFLGCKYGIPALQRAGGGSIINTASFVAKIGAATSQVAYTASKGGVLSLSKELAVIHARQNIRVNALCPGPLRTDLLDKFLNTDEKRQRRLVHIPMGRFGQAIEIAQAAVFLASDESSFMTGTEFLVDGGITAAYVTPI